MDKLLKAIQGMQKNLRSDWRMRLEALNIYENVSPLYDSYSHYEANIILSFLVFAYHKDSTYLEIHKDRIDNTLTIMRSLVGDGLTADGLYYEVATLDTRDEAIQSVTEWVIDYQKDYRWKSVLASFAYAAKVLKIASNMDNVEDPRKIKEIGHCLEVGDARRKYGEKTLREMQEDFVTLDTILEQENKPKATALPTWETHVRLKKNK